MATSLIESVQKKTDLKDTLKAFEDFKKQAKKCMK